MHVWVLLLYSLLLLLAHGAIEEEGRATDLSSCQNLPIHIESLEETQAYCYVRSAIETDYPSLSEHDWQLDRQLDRRGEWATDEDRKQLVLRNFFLSHMTPRDDWNARRQELLVKLLVNQVGLPPVSPERVIYPWDGIEDWMEENGRDQLPLVAFGSLMHQGSAAMDIASLGRPVIAFGVRRHFNYIHLRPELSFLGMPTEKHLEEAARLNVSYSGHTNDIINGVLVYVDIDDIDRLRIRENGYDLIKIQILDYGDAANVGTSKMQFREAFILSNPEGSLHRSTSLSFMPHVNYANICLEGVYEIERQGMPGFFDLFVRTTYLNDGRTLDQWITDLAQQEARHQAVYLN